MIRLTRSRDSAPPTGPVHGNPSYIKLVRCALDNSKPSPLSLAVTDNYFSRTRHAIEHGSPGQDVFNDLARKVCNYFIPANTSAPLQRLSSVVVPVEHMIDDVVRDIREVVASVMASEREPSPTDAVVQFAVKTLIG